MKSVGDRWQELKEECDKQDCQWSARAFQVGGETFAGQMLPSYRNFISSHRFVLSSENKIFCFGDTLGNIREAYESFSTLLYFNRIDWMKSLLDPIFEYCEDNHWVKRYPPYDIGLYPIINKQVKLDDNAVAVAADMLMMMAVIVEVEQDFINSFISPVLFFFQRGDKLSPPYCKVCPSSYPISNAPLSSFFALNF